MNKDWEKLFEFSNNEDRFVLLFKKDKGYIVSSNIECEAYFCCPAKLYHFEKLKEAKQKFIDFSKELLNKEQDNET